jgi:VanZ family protein
MATQASNAERHASAPHFLYLWLGYVVFVIYGSLVPLQYKARPWGEAVATFQKIPFLKLGIESRADWISNGVLYVPVGILTVLALRAVLPRLATVLALPIALLFCAALAVGVEFTQLFFPPRTVSQNDLMAELIGSVIGLVWVTRFSGWFTSIIHSLLQDRQRLFHLALDAYVIAYLAFAMFPFDLLLSAGEIAVKANSNSWGWLLAGSDSRASIVLLRLTAEIVLTLPLGWWLARWIQSRKSRKRARHREHHRPSTHYGSAIAFGLALGLVLEIAQFFIASGTSQGLSVLTRLVGVVAGVALSRYALGWTLEDAARWLRRFGTVLLLPYLLALLEVNGWLSNRWMGFDYAQVQWVKVNFMPFYYHYFTTEAIALFSLAAVFLTYLPVGVLCWAARINPIMATLLGMMAATLIETGKLFIKGMHPDPTNALIAGAAISLTLAALKLATTPRASTQTMAAGSNAMPGDAAAQDNHLSTQARHLTPTKGAPVKLLALAALCCAALLWVITLPGAAFLAGSVLLAASIAVWLKPHWAFGIIAAALPVFDLAPLTGRFFLDEFDVLTVLALCIAFARAPIATPRRESRARKRFSTVNAWPAIAAIIFGAVFAISTAAGLVPWQWPDLNAFNSYFSPYNALRIAKGAVWAGLFWWVSQRFSNDTQSPRKAFSAGLVLGLALTVAVVVWERIAFVGLLDFTTDYRITGPMSAMHVGGAFIECFLAAAAPVLVFFMVTDRRWWVLAAGMALLAATTYALMVTFSRNGYFAFAVGLSIVFVASLTMKGRTGAAGPAGRFARNSLLAGGALAAVLAIAVPIFKGEFSQARMATVSADLQVRQAHWQDALSLRDGGWFTALFGMGVGRYPATNLWSGTALPTLATYQLTTESGNTFLRLSSGSPVYVEQVVSVEPLQRLVLKLSVRPKAPNARLTISVCEKWMLTSFNCAAQAFEFGNELGKWINLEREFVAQAKPTGMWQSLRPAKLSLSYVTEKSSIDIDALSLRTENGGNLIRNGDFSNGLDHWFFSADSHLQWHVKSLFVGTLFDQGWLGLLALMALLTTALARAASNTYRGQLASAAALAALLSVLVIGLFDTLIDSPRYLMLLLLLVWLACAPREKLATVKSTDR